VSASESMCARAIHVGQDSVMWSCVTLSGCVRRRWDTPHAVRSEVRSVGQDRVVLSAVAWVLYETHNNYRAKQCLYAGSVVSSTWQAARCSVVVVALPVDLDENAQRTSAMLRAHWYQMGASASHGPDTWVLLTRCEERLGLRVTRMTREAPMRCGDVDQEEWSGDETQERNQEDGWLCAHKQCREQALPVRG